MVSVSTHVSDLRRSRSSKRLPGLAIRWQTGLSAFLPRPTGPLPEKSRSGLFSIWWSSGFWELALIGASGSLQASDVQLGRGGGEAAVARRCVEDEQRVTGGSIRRSSGITPTEPYVRCRVRNLL